MSALHELLEVIEFNALDELSASHELSEVNEFYEVYAANELNVLEKQKNSTYAGEASNRWTSPRGLEFLIDSPPAKQASRWLDKHASARIALDQLN